MKSTEQRKKQVGYAKKLYEQKTKGKSYTSTKKLQIRKQCNKMAKRKYPI